MTAPKQRAVVRRLRRRLPTQAVQRAFEIIYDQRNEIAREVLPGMLSAYVGRGAGGPNHQVAAAVLVNFAFYAADAFVEHMKAQVSE